MSDKAEVLFEFLARLHVKVVEFHSSSPWVAGRADTERGHASAVDVQSAVWEEVQEEPIIRLLGVRYMTAPVVVIDDAVESGWVKDRECRMSVLAMKAFLITVYHRLPVEVAFIFEAASVWTTSEVDRGKSVLQFGEEFIESWSIFRDRGKEQSSSSQMTA